MRAGAIRTFHVALLAGTVLATFIPLASFDVARADPALRLAQAPLTPEQVRELVQIPRPLK